MTFVEEALALEWVCVRLTLSVCESRIRLYWQVTLWYGVQLDLSGVLTKRCCQGDQVTEVTGPGLSAAVFLKYGNKEFKFHIEKETRFHSFLMLESLHHQHKYIFLSLIFISPFLLRWRWGWGCSSCFLFFCFLGGQKQYQPGTKL